MGRRQDEIARATGEVTARLAAQATVEGSGRLDGFVHHAAILQVF